MRYLVTGGSGFIGAALVKRLLSDGHQVRVLDNLCRGRAARLADVTADVDFVEADVRDTQAVDRAAKGVDAVVHLAAVNGTENFYRRPELVLDVGVRGMLAVLDACRKQSVGQLIVASSSETYQTPCTVPTDESVPLVVPDVLNPRYSYGASKIASELLAVNYGRTGFDRVVIFRPHNVYGPDMGWEHVLPQFILRALDRIDATPTGPVAFPIQGDGRQTRAFIHIDDFIEGLSVVLAKAAHLNVYNIGTPEEIAIADVARRVVAHFGREALVKPGPPALGGTPRRCPDIGKLGALGFTPKIPFAEGLPSIANWYARNRHLAPAGTS